MRTIQPPAARTLEDVCGLCGRVGVGKGQMGSALTGSLQISWFLTEGLFGYSRQPTFYLPKSARAYLFPQSVKSHYLCSGPISVDPISLKPNHPVWAGSRGRAFSAGSRAVGEQRHKKGVAATGERIAERDCSLHELRETARPFGMTARLSTPA